MTQRWSSRGGQPVVVSALALTLALFGLQALAQTTDTPAPKADAKVKAQEEGDKVFKWILINADHPKRAAPAAEAKPAPAPAPAPRPVAKVREPKDQGIVEKVEPMTRNASATPQKTQAPAHTPATEVAQQAPAPAAAAASTPSPMLAAQNAPAASAPDNALALAAPESKPAEVPPPAAADDDDEPLTLVKQVDPQFPRFLIERLEKGAVQVRFEVQPDGSVKAPQVVKSSHPRLNEAAMQAVAQWRFKPLHHAQSGVVELKFDLTQ